jgi:hypothetical protein
VYLSPYSAVVTGAFDLITEYIPPTGLVRQALNVSLKILRTSIGNLSCYLKQVVIPNISIALRHCPGCNICSGLSYAKGAKTRRGSFLKPKN